MCLSLPGAIRTWRWTRKADVADVICLTMASIVSAVLLIKYIYYFYLGNYSLSINQPHIKSIEGSKGLGQ